MAVCVGCGAELPPPKRASGRARKWCSDRCRKRTLYTRECIDCGGPCDGASGEVKSATRCLSCSRGRGSEVAQRMASAKQQRFLAAYMEGGTAREIAGRLGISENYVHIYAYRMRRYGYDLPHLRPAEHVAAVKAGRWGTAA